MALIMGRDPNTGQTLTYTEGAALAAKRSGKEEDIAFTAGGVDRAIERIQDVIDLKVRKAKRSTTRALKLEDPADWASRAYVRDINSFHESYDKWNDQYVKRLQKLVTKLEKVKKDYMEREDEAGARFRGELKD